MNEFFKGWRRKIGLVTLVLTCVFVAGWVETMVQGQSVQVWIESTDLSFFSWRGELQLWLHSGVDPVSFRESKIAWGRSVPYLDQNAHLDIWTVPYWFIVIPLTAFAAALLFSNPRQSNPEKAPEPIVPKLD